MKPLHVRRVCSSAVTTLAFLLVAAPLLVAQSAPESQADRPKIDLNTATQAALEDLPGIDTDAARLIIAGRPYSSVSDLSKAGLPTSTVEAITPLVKVGPLGTASGATEKGTQKAATGVGKAAAATAKGIEKGVDAATKGVQKGASATASAADTVNRKLTGAPRHPPQAGMVWADKATRAYYKEGDPSYGTTKKGKWLTEEEAIKGGYRMPGLKGAGEKKL